VVIADLSGRFGRQTDQPAENPTMTEEMMSLRALLAAQKPSSFSHAPGQSAFAPINQSSLRFEI